MNTPLAESRAIGSPLSGQIQSNQKRKSTSPLCKVNKQRPTSVRIEPHVLTDAQSNGIVSRLVKYYDQSNESDRSRIVYNKFGDFPLVQLKKTELKRPISRSSSVRIAPPNKTVMNPNLRAAIIRSNSFQLRSGIPKIIPTKMRAKDDSHKIITNHEPITDNNYPVSSKSVLDALEKNCRKRINNEELILDRNKKFCSPLVSEVDSPSPREFMPIQQTTKRNREEISPVKSLTTSIDGGSNQPLKKIKTKNNALLSSLSSSHYELLPTISSTIQKNFRSLSIPSAVKVTPEQKDQIVQTVEEKTTNVVTNDTKKDEAKEVEQPLRKLQLFNVKPVSNAALNRAKLNNFSDEDENDDEFKIRFVKPKENVLENYEVINYVEQDKLNRMLKGLSQGIKSPVKEVQKSTDTVDSRNHLITLEKTVAASISFSTSTTTSTVAPISTPASVSINLPSIPSVTEQKDSSSTSSSTLTTSTSSLTTDTLVPKPTFETFQFGSAPTTTESLKIPQTVASNNILGSSKPVSPLALFTTPKADSQSEIDTNKSLISFTPLKPTTISTSTESGLSLPTTSSSQTLKSITTNVGVKFGEYAVPKLDNKASAFSFGASQSESSTEKKESNVGFSFGGNIGDNSSISLPITSAPSFSFGSITPQLPTTSTLVAPTVSTQPTLSFQNSATSVKTSASTTNNLFSFGTNSNPVTSNVSSTSAFGASPLLTSNTISFSEPTTTKASGIGFSFGTTPTTVKPTSGFAFGSSQQPQSTTIASTASIPSIASSTSSFAFSGAQIPATTQSTGMFASVKTAVPGFSFGGNGAVAPAGGLSGFGAVQKTESSTAGIFSFGQKPQTAPVATTTANSGFNFGSQPNNSTLSAQPIQSSGFSFGGSATASQNNTTSKSGGIFSRLGDKQSENKPFSFGGSNAINNLQPLQSVSSFGDNSCSMSSSTNASTAFAPSTNTTTPVFGQNVNSGGNLFSTNKSGNNQVNSPFGNSSNQPAQQGNNLFSFNSSTNNNNQQQTGIFGFGNNTSNNNKPQQSVSPISVSNNIFGSSNNNAGQNVSASFTFKPSSANASTAQSPFGQSSPAPPAYQFGASGNNSNTNVSTSFTFSGGSSVQPVAQTAPSSAPVFSFGNSTPSLGTGNFNFQGQQTPVPQSSPVNANLFNIGTGGNQQRRPTRVATRRYK